MTFNPMIELFVDDKIYAQDGMRLPKGAMITEYHEVILPDGFSAEQLQKPN